MFQTRSDDPISCYGTNEIAYCIGVPVATVRIVGLSLIVDKGLEGLDPPSNTVVRQTDLDVTIRQCLLSDMNPACAIVIRRKTLYGPSSSLHGRFSAPHLLVVVVMTFYSVARILG